MQTIKDIQAKPLSKEEKQAAIAEALLANTKEFLDQTLQDINALGEEFFGRDFYGDLQGCDDWKHLDSADRNKLRAALLFELISNNVIEDFRQNLFMLGITALPGPGGIGLVGGALTTYPFRLDPRTIQMREQIEDMFQKGVELIHFQDVLRHNKYNPNKLEVDDAALLKREVMLIKTGMEGLFEEFKTKIGNGYKKLKEKTATKIHRAAHRTLRFAFNEQSIDNFLETLNWGYMKFEYATKAVFQAIMTKLEQGKEWLQGRVASPAFQEFSAHAAGTYQVALNLTGEFLHNVHTTKNDFISFEDTIAQSPFGQHILVPAYNESSEHTKAAGHVTIDLTRKFSQGVRFNRDELDRLSKTRAYEWIDNNVISPTLSEAYESTKAGYHLSQKFTEDMLKSYDRNKEYLKEKISSLTIF